MTTFKNHASIETVPYNFYGDCEVCRYVQKVQSMIDELANEAARFRLMLEGKPGLSEKKAFREFRKYERMCLQYEAQEEALERWEG